MAETFDLAFENPLETNLLPLKTIGEILFSEIDGRGEESKIILSHFENQYIEISLRHLRRIVSALFGCFDNYNISKGDTVILLTFHGCNEMITALYFIALASRGCRTFLPMYSEEKEFSRWIDLTHSKHIIAPLNEVMSLEGHDKEKTGIREIRGLAAKKGINILDNISDFRIDELIVNEDPLINNAQEHLKFQAEKSLPGDDVLIVTTSGTSGKSKLIVYTHEAYHLNCLAWKKAGFYDKNILGGIGFTPLLTHTMGIRALINALWTGSPVCLIITEWFFTRPETVRYLLLKMKPEHITGGPAVYNTFLELFRIFPEIKQDLSKNLKTLVSSGAAFDTRTAREVFNATGLYLHNAFGTTESQQVFSTILSPEISLDSNLIPLGKPLPGVKIGLVKAEEQNHYRLYIKSAFSHKYCLGEEEGDQDGYFDTGDIVKIDGNDCYFYIRRASLDYFKDSFGVKIPVASIKEYYASQIPGITHAEFFPVLNFPGLSGLFFVNEDNSPPGQVSDNTILKKFSSYVEEINNRLINSIEPFEFQHRHLSRIALINNPPPETGKGTVSGKQINIDYHDLISRLTDTRKESSGIISTDILMRGTYKYSQYLSPLLGDLMSALKLNCHYHRGEKDSLFTYIHGKEVEILDATGGYGTNLLGHNHPEICNEIKNFITAKKIAISNQLSLQEKTCQLAEKLNLIVGSKTSRNYRIIFGNSGSEAVEIAIHHAYFEWTRRIERIREQQIQMFASCKEVNISTVWEKNKESLKNSSIQIIALVNSFHGNTTGARTILGNIKRRNMFSKLMNIETVFLDDRKEDWYETLKEIIDRKAIILEKLVREDQNVNIVPFRVSTIIAAFAEPVTGEGGVRIVNRNFLKELAKYDFPLISDEIQCGLGRTGNFPELPEAHYYLFGKALGGGIEKISAVLIEKSRFCNKFSEYYSSTFGNGELAAAAGLKTLEIVESGSFRNRILETGNYLKEKLDDLHHRFPEVIAGIEGKGLMFSVYFNRAYSKDNIILRLLFEKEKACYLFSAWLLNRHHIRMFPTISAPDTLRLEPSAYLTLKEADRVLIALDELCTIIRDKRMYDLFLFLMDDDPFSDQNKSSAAESFFMQELQEPDSRAVKVAFIAHFAFTLKELRMLVPDFARASDTGLRIMFNRMETLMEMEPVEMIALNLCNGKVHFSFWVIPLDSSELEFLHKSGKRKDVILKIQKAVDLAAEKGAEVISLGGFTSIMTNNGLALSEPSGSRIITGNTLTAASGLIHLENEIKQNQDFRKPNIIAIVGSTGNIGQVITEILCEQEDICTELLLISRSEKKTNDFLQEMGKEKDIAVKFTVSEDISIIERADIIVVCSNTSDPIVLPHHIAAGKPVLISDLSVPSAVSLEVYKLPNVKMMPFSAWVTLPADREAVISSYSPPGTIFCCAAEAILLGLEKFSGSLKGRINSHEVKEITLLAQKHDFLKGIGSMGSFKTSRM